MPTRGTSTSEWHCTAHLSHTCSDMHGHMEQTRICTCIMYRTHTHTHTHLLDLRSSNPYGQNGEMAEEFGWLVKNIWLGGYKSMAPRDLKVGGASVSDGCVRWVGLQQVLGVRWVGLRQVPGVSGGWGCSKCWVSGGWGCSKCWMCQVGGAAASVGCQVGGAAASAGCVR